MRSRRLLLLFYCCLSYQFLGAQAYYKLKLPVPLSSDSLPANALLIVNESGGGLVRINWADTSLYEMELNEQFVFRTDGILDSTLTIYEAKSPVLKKGSSITTIKPLSFWFKLNPETKNVAPWLITVSN